MTTPSLENLLRATQIAQRIEQLQAELSAVLSSQQGGSSSQRFSENRSAGNQSVERRGPRTMSPEARERIAAAQRARWAKQKGGNKNASSGRAPAGGGSRSAGKEKRGKRTISPEARAKMAEAARRRWSKQKKAV
jgi:hypothetical protein